MLGVAVSPSLKTERSKRLVAKMFFDVNNIMNGKISETYKDRISRNFKWKSGSYLYLWLSMFQGFKGGYWSG